MSDKGLGVLLADVVYEENGRKKISCAAVMKIAKENDIALSEAGQACNEERIQISQCQLGCFK